MGPLTFVIGAITIPFIALGWNARAKRLVLKRVMELLHQFEDKYVRLRNQHIAMVLTDGQMDGAEMRKFISKAEVIVKPEMEAFINQAILVGSFKSYLKPSETLFPNVVSLVNQWTHQMNVNDKDRDEFKFQLRQAFSDGVSADIENRILNWKAGEPLS
ncbi:MAG: hypothetical protein AAFY71_02180 [Bacteroidota bacterium]